MKHKRYLWPLALLAALALLLALASPWAWANGGQWQEYADGPGPRFGHTMVTIDNDIYLFGGLVQTGPGTGVPQNDLWEFQQQNDWAEIIASTPPPARYGHGAAESDGKMYILGGMDAEGNTLNDMWKYDPASNAWTQITAVGAPPDRAYHSMVTLPDGKLAVLGGITKANGTYVSRSDLWIFDPVANTWTRGADAPKPIYGASTVVTPDGKLCVLSGHGIAPHSNPPVYIYDPAGDSWSSITPVGAAPDAPRLLASAALSGGRAYMFGGQHEDTFQIFNDTWEFDFTTNTWTQQADMPIALMSAAAAPANGQVILFGGVQSDETASDRTFGYWPAGAPSPTPTPTATPMPIPVGGYVEPVNRLVVLAPWLGLAALAALAALTVALVRRRGRA